MLSTSEVGPILALIAPSPLKRTQFSYIFRKRLTEYGERDLEAEWFSEDNGVEQG